MRVVIAGLMVRGSLAVEAPRAYLTHLDSNCLRNPFRNTYKRPKYLQANGMRVTQPDLSFVESARKSRDSVPVNTLVSIADDLTQAAADIANAEVVQGAAWSDEKLVEFEYLPFLDLWILQRPHQLTSEQFETVLAGIPCAVVGPTMEQFRPYYDHEDRRRSQRWREWSEERGRYYMRGMKSDDPFDASSLTEYFKNGTSVDTFWKGDPAFQQNGKMLQEAGAAAASTMRGAVALRLPSDSLIGKQWYLFGENQGIDYGANVVDAWTASVLVNQLRGGNALDQDLLPQDGVIDFSKVLESHPGITVAIADSGCTNNVDLVNKLDSLPGCPGATRCSGYDYGSDSPNFSKSTESHGTQTAGLIGAESDNAWGISSTCPNCKILCLKIYNDQTKSLSTTAIVRAIEHIAQSGAKLSNHSYGGFGDDRLERFAFERLLKDGNHLAFVAAGNAGCNIDCARHGTCNAGKKCSNTQIWTPASYKLPGLISIASSTKKGTVSMFSNTGLHSVHLFTPGSEIVSIDKKGSPQGTVGSGTSFASPIAAGIAAFIWSVFPNASALQIQDALLSTTRYNPKLEGLSTNAGIIDAFAALDHLWKSEL